MASEQLKTVLELVGSADLGTLTLQERRALMGSAGARSPAAAGGGRGHRADRQLAARGPGHPVTAPSAGRHPTHF
jgi:hypothetical protein